MIGTICSRMSQCWLVALIKEAVCKSTTAFAAPGGGQAGVGALVHGRLAPEQPP
jgi:hypothetical protein